MTAGRSPHPALPRLPTMLRGTSVVVFLGALLVLLSAAAWGIAGLLWTKAFRVPLPGGRTVELTLPLVFLGLTVLLMVVELAVLLSDAGVRAVARQTFTQCLRKKVTVAFAVPLLASVALLPAAMEGDGTLAGRIRTFLDYSSSITSLLLSLMVVFLSVGVVSTDVAAKHVYTVCTKPVGRWQYIVGRWVGVVALSAVLLGVAAAEMGLCAQYLRGRTDLAIGPEDRRAVDTEVFTARAEVPADPPDVDQIVVDRIRQRRANGTWSDIVEPYMTHYELSRAEAEKRVEEDMRKEAIAEEQSVAPGASLAWRFSKLRIVGETIGGRGKVVDIKRGVGLVKVEVDPRLSGRLVIFGPVWVNGVGGRAVGIWNQGFHAVFHLEDMNGQQMAGLRAGQEADVVVEPMFQLSYKISPSGETTGEELRAAWAAENPSTGYVYYVPPQDTPARTRATLVVPARTIDAQGNLRVRFLNHSPYSVTVLSRDVAILYEVGRFEGTFLKTIVLILLGLMFLAALGVFAGSWLSFPVACLLSFVLLGFAATLRFLTEAVTLGLEYPPDKGLILFYQVGFYMLQLVKVLLPDLASALATDYLVEGLAIPWAYFAKTAAMTVAVHGVILLGLACVIFQRRELARVQV